MPTTADKATQEAEAQARVEQTKGIGQDDPTAVDGVFGDTPDQISDAAPQPQEGEQPQREAPQRPPNQRLLTRDAIIKSFRDKRQEDIDSDEEDMREHDLLPPELKPQPKPQEEEEITPAVEDKIEEEQPPAPPAKRVLKIRGKEIELTQDEIDAAAQKALAADNYLDEARSKLDQVNDLLRTTQQKAGPGPVAQHQGDEPAQTGQGDEPGEGEHPADPLKEAIEQIQYGDPSEVGAKLAAAIDQAADKKATEAAGKALMAERIRDENARSKALMAEFSKDNPEIANDPISRTAFETILIQKQVEDLIGLGIEPDQVKGLDPKAIANWHRDLRVNGYKVKSAATLLEEGNSVFKAWRQPAAAPAPKEETPKAPARVAVTVDRTARRESIQTQPTRAAVPQRRETPAAPAEPNRSAIVARIAQDRAKKRGAAV